MKRPLKRIAVLGSTGSVGVNALRVISRYPDRFRVAALACGANVELLSRQARIFRPHALGVNDLSKIKKLKSALGRTSIKIFAGPEGLIDIAGIAEADLVLIAISGNVSLLPLIRAIEAKKDIALASKEPLVSAGEIIMHKVRQNKISLIPVDSEHSAIFQCLRGRMPDELKKIYLTGTGGPLRNVKRSLFDKLTRAEVLNHPKWKMGKKISVDSATLMNKGLEVIEAKWLFGVAPENIRVLMHPEAIIHSMVELIDGALLAQLAVPDMRLPIQYALNFPERLPTDRFNVDFDRLRKLTFHAPDLRKFPCLLLAYEALRAGGSAPAALNAANEEAVGMYLGGRLAFTSIPKVVGRVLKAHRVVKDCGIKDILSVDKWAREEARRFAAII